MAAIQLSLCQGRTKLDRACQGWGVRYNALRRRNPMNEHSQYPDVFDATETKARLYELIAVACFIILAFAVVAMYELR
jgi:hypothetical protein